MQETWVRSLGWEDRLEKGKAPTPVFWPGEFQGLYGPRGHKESDTTETFTAAHLLWLGFSPPIGVRRVGKSRQLLITHPYSEHLRLWVTPLISRRKRVPSSATSRIRKAILNLVQVLLMVSGIQILFLLQDSTHFIKSLQEILLNHFVIFELKIVVKFTLVLQI